MKKMIFLSLLLTTLINGLLIYFLDLNSVTGPPIILFDIIVIIAVILFYFFPNRKITNTLKIYFVAFPVTFFTLLYIWIDQKNELKSEVKFFNFNSKRYEIDINKSERVFSINLIQNEDGSSLSAIVYGTYILKNDTIILKDNEQKKVYKIINDKFIGFPTVGSSCVLE